MSSKGFRVEPAYNFLADQPEYELTLPTPVRVTINGEVFEGQGQAILRVSPEPTVLLRGEVKGVSSMLYMRCAFEPDLVSNFEFGGQTIDGFSGGIGGTAPAKSNPVSWHPRSEPVFGRGNDATVMSRIVFHLFNFREIQTPGTGGAEERDGAGRAIHQVILESAELRVGITSLYETMDRQRQIRQRGGVRMTHVGFLERRDGSSFTGKQAFTWIARLGDYLSFTNGRRCWATCPCGFDSHGNRVWEGWSSPTLGRGAVDSWFHQGRCEQIVQSFPCYMATVEDTTWTDTLHEAIYLYLMANESSRGIDAGIILTQAALERLAYSYLVNSRFILTRNQFRNARAADNLRKLFTELGIPIEISAGCATLNQLNDAPAIPLNWDDLPHALTSVRNSLVHPEPRNREHFAAAYYDTWRAGLWCLDMSILGVCGYQGEHWNRVAGSITSVPWAAPVT